MNARRYRRKRSVAGEMLADTTYVANRLSWKCTLVLGVVLFVVTYWLIPAWLNHHLQSQQGSPVAGMLQAVFARRVHWFQWLGIAFALICGFFAVRNYFSAQRLDRRSEQDVSFFSRLFARLLD
jgi:hypothetical protein